MIVAGSASPLLLASAGGYNLTRSLRFRRSASAYLNRLPVSAGNRQIFTISMWVKRGILGATRQCLFSAGLTGVGSSGSIVFDSTSSDQLIIQGNGGGSYLLNTTQVFRDPSAWYHLVIAFDTPQATASNRIKLYVNGTQVTTFGTATYPAQNYNSDYNNTVAHNIASRTDDGLPPVSTFDGYLTEVNFIDGQTLTPSSFGANSDSTGVWQPKKYAGTYGTNGFYLPFTDNSALTTSSNVGLGKDFSGNGNYWTTNNISITAGSTYDSMTDVPTLTSATAANYCVLNPLQSAWWAGPSRGAISNGNLTLIQNNGTAFSTFDVSTGGKWYIEGTVTSYGQGAAQSQFIVSARSRSTFEVSYLSNGLKTVNSSNSSYGSSWTTGDIIGIAVDPANNQVTFYKNNVSQGAITNTFPSETVLVGYYAEATGTDTINFNFGQRPFTYTPPTGFVALNTFNLPTPSIGATASTQANKYFDISLWSGDNTTSRLITNTTGFRPDLTWVKARSVAGQSHNIVDSVRGLGTNVMNTLYSNETITEQSVNTNASLSPFYGAVGAINSNGFTVTAGSGGATDQVNKSGTTYVGWQWKANGTGVSNTAGSITSTVSANTSAGFSVVTYTGNATSGATVGHGLGVAPSMIIVKCRNSGVAHDWRVYHVSLGNTKNLQLNLTDAAQTTSVTWNNTSPSSTVFTLGSGGATNESGTNLVAYCFSEVAGYSKFSSYTGNGSSTAGPFVYTGFKPKYVVIKCTSSAGQNWVAFDTSRSPFNLAGNVLYPNLSNGEGTGTTDNIDFLSNGFRVLGTSGGSINQSQTYIYMAFASNPFKYSLAQ